jgi:hypothetical protein
LSIGSLRDYHGGPAGVLPLSSACSLLVDYLGQIGHTGGYDGARTARHAWQVWHQIGCEISSIEGYKELGMFDMFVRLSWSVPLIITISLLAASPGGGQPSLVFSSKLRPEQRNLG